MEFKKWTLNEGMWDWLKKTGKAFSQGSPVNQQTIGTYPGKYVDNTGREIPNAQDVPMAQPYQPKMAARQLKPNISDDQAYGAKLYGQMARQGQMAQQKKPVGFRIEDMNGLKSAIADYLGLISKFMTTVHQQIPYPQFIQRAVNSFEKHVGPAYKELYSKIKWIDDMNNLARNQYEWTNEELFIETVKVSYRRFEDMIAALRNLATTMKNWAYAIASKLPPEYAQKFKNVYESGVLRQQAFVGRQVQFLQGKIRDLMSRNNIAYNRE